MGLPIKIYCRFAVLIAIIALGFWQFFRILMFRNIDLETTPTFVIQIASKFINDNHIHILDTDGNEFAVAACVTADTQFRSPDTQKRCGKIWDNIQVGNNYEIISTLDANTYVPYVIGNGEFKQMTDNPFELYPQIMYMNDLNVGADQNSPPIVRRKLPPILDRYISVSRETINNKSKLRAQPVCNQKEPANAM